VLVLTDMGRGLSDLQKKILHMAYQNRTIKERKQGVDLRYPDVLREWWGWEPVRGPRWEKGERCDASSQYFSKRQIGEREYRSAEASLSRAVGSLAERGLVYRARLFGHGVVNLTEEGTEVAARLAE
jgi:hypothetical protein